MLASGVISCNKTNVKDVCYKKWLGPDWKPSFEGAGIQISNHQSWIDIMSLLYVQCPSFVAKADVASYPGVGKIASAIQTLFTNRGGTKEERVATLKAIEDR